MLLILKILTIMIFGSCTVIFKSLCKDNLTDSNLTWNGFNSVDEEEVNYSSLNIDESELTTKFEWVILKENSIFHEICRFALRFTYYSSSALIINKESEFLLNNLTVYYQYYIGPVVLSDNRFHTEKITIMFISNESLFYNNTDKLFRDLSVFYVFIIENMDCNLTEIFIHLWDKFRIYNYLAMWNYDPNIIYGYDIIAKTVIKLNNEELYNRSKYHLGRFKDWYRTEIKTVIFARAPSLLYDWRGGVKLSGYDGMVLKSMDDYLNLSLLLYHTMDDERFGYVLGNGTLVGTIKDVVDRTVDFTGNAHFVKWYNVPFLEFSHYVTSEKLCISVPKKGKVPNLFAIFQTFNLESSILFLLTYLSTGIIYACFKLTYVKMGKYKNYNTCTPLQMFLLSIGGSITFKGHLSSEKLLLGPLFVASLFTVNTFQSTLMTLLTTPSFYRDINTIKELRESRTEIWTSSNDLSLLQDLGLNIIVRSQKVMIDAQSNSRIGRIIRFNILSGSQDTYGGLKLLTPYHVVKECLGNFYVSYMVPRGSPLLEGLNWLVATLIESGFIAKWIHESDRLTSPKKTNSKEKPTVISNSFGLNDLMAAFMFLIIGTLMGVIIFLIEITIYHWHYKNKACSLPNLKKISRKKKIKVLPYLE